MPEIINLPGLALVAPHAQLVAERKKTVFIKTKSSKNYVGDEVFVVEDGKVWARITFGDPKKITIKQFKTMERRHKISDEERKKRWKGKRNFYSYSINLIESYIPPIKAGYLKGSQDFVKEVTVEMPGEEVEKVGSGYEDIPVRERPVNDEVTHPMVTRLDDIISHDMGEDVDDVVIDRLDGERHDVFPPKQDGPLLERGKVDKGFKGKLQEYRRFFGNKEIIEQPASVREIKKTVQPRNLLDRFKAKLEGK